ncbi:MAG: lipoprotein signal peptidase [Bacteroidales bacterium]|nr:lipoprotein signal peptidase [Bacteroidales bacterium]
MKVSKGTRITLLVILLLVIDQVIKILVKTNMSIGQSIHVIGNWFQILFIENNGMAFGLQFGEGWGKLALSLCRLVLIVLIIIYLRKLLKKPDVPWGVLAGLAAILCGAIGNMIDSMFYGIIFDYAPFLYGRVVDMFYFPIIDTTLPANFPVWGGRHVIFFRPIFNFADSCITCGAFYLLLFQWKFFAGEKAAGEAVEEKSGR